MEIDDRDSTLLDTLRRAIVDVLAESAAEAGALRRQLAGLKPETPLRALGIDSLSAVEIASSLGDMLGVALPDDELSDATVGGLLQLLRRVAPDPRVPLVAKYPTLAQLLRTRAQTDKNRIALTFLGDAGAGSLDASQRYSYGELYDRSAAVALALRERLPAGSRVVIAAELPDEFVPLFFGCVLGGLVAVPVSRPSRRERAAKLNAIVASSGAGAVVLGRGARPSEPTADECAREIVGNPIAAAELLRADGTGANALTLPSDPDALAFLQYTSGSTGSPKGVMVRHRDVLANMRMIADSFANGRQDIWTSWLPVHHDMGLIGDLIQPLHAGGSAVLMHASAFVRDPLAWLDVISRYRGTISGAPNFAFEMCVRALARGRRPELDLSSWRVAYNGAEPVREQTLQRFSDAFHEYGFRAEAHFPCYGMAEATLFLAGGPADHGALVAGLDTVALEQGRVQDHDGSSTRRQHRVVACGRIARGVDVRIVDPNALVSSAGSDIGEIWVQGPNVAAGYFGQPELTEQVFRAHTREGHGPYLRTGDLGFVRAGRIYITGRLKDLVIINGRNLHPQDIEDVVLVSHELLQGRRGAVFATSGPRSELLIVVQETAVRQLPAEQAELVRDSVRNAVAGALDVPVSDVVLVSPGSLPVTTSGKVRRGECRTRYLQGTLERLPETEAPPVERRGALDG